MACCEEILANLNYFSTAIILLGILPLLLFWHSLKKQTYWKDRNVPYVKPFPFVGSLIDTLTTPYIDLETKRYQSLGPIYGHFEFNEPALTILDPILIRDILVKDFAFFINKKSLKTGYNVIDQMLAFSEGEDWKRLRTIISPSFSMGKIKRVSNILKECSKTLVNNFRAAAEKKEPLDAKKFIEAFAMDLVARSAFSTKLDSFNDPENIFVKQARNLVTNFGRNLCIFSLIRHWPQFMKLINFSIFEKSAVEYFKRTTLSIISERKKTKQTIDDFMQSLLDTAEKIDPKDKDDAENDNDFIENYAQSSTGQKSFVTNYQTKLTNDELVAQCLNFFGASFETTSTLITYTIYALATHQDIQEKAYKEIVQCLEETNGEVTYTALKEMKYMDSIICESLRIHPPFMKITRRAEKDYELRDTGITIEKGLTITIPIVVLHRDPKYYPNPEKYDPDRFSAEEIAKRDPYVYIPFGCGPRHCIGMRFVLMNAKMCLVHIISSFKIKTCPQTQIPLESDVSTMFVYHPKGVNVALEIRHDSPLAA